jgi:hypothetical protein
MFKEPKLYNGFVSRRLILHLIKKALIEDAKKNNRHVYSRTGRKWGCRSLTLGITAACMTSAGR